VRKYSVLSNVGTCINAWIVSIVGNLVVSTALDVELQSIAKYGYVDRTACIVSIVDICVVYEDSLCGDNMYCQIEILHPILQFRATLPPLKHTIQYV